MAPYFCVPVNCKKNTRSETFAVELMKNKASGKYFIVLDDTGSDDLLVITPQGKVKRIERNLFVRQDTVSAKDAPSDYNLTKTQTDKYHEYFDE
ncbi:MAG: hypothetical protein JRE28_11670 [Deltaproteobacteria bacterium]|nr:hypothetical protein [Deltaproteobacteria bacterium]